MTDCRIICHAELNRFQSTHPRRVWLDRYNGAFCDSLFQSTHPRRVWQTGLNSLTPEPKFQSTHPRRVWHAPDHHPSRGVGFNPHTHEGCDIYHIPRFSSLRSFNPHTHEGCDYSCQRYHYQVWRFNPHTHEGCDAQGCIDTFSSCVSIHTPTKGVTSLCWYLSFSLCKFQSTHPRRVWLGYTLGKGKVKMFQSTHPRRVWLRFAYGSVLHSKFQSTHPRRVWPIIDCSTGKGMAFQSTHPRRVWQQILSAKYSFWSFNPHTHEGCDIEVVAYVKNEWQFQSTHPRRVWLFFSFL